MLGDRIKWKTDQIFTLPVHVPDKRKLYDPELYRAATLGKSKCSVCIRDDYGLGQREKDNAAQRSWLNHA